jgi:serine phosphatase RsbU (regulator of sigma subunit)
MFSLFRRFYFLGLAGLSLVLPLRLWGLSGFYWEPPAALSPAGGSFPLTASNGRLAAAVWQEAEPGAPGEGGLVRIALGLKSPGEPWRIFPSLGDPYRCAGEEAPLLGLSLDSRDRIIVAAADPAGGIDILISGDRGESFQTCRIDAGVRASEAPRLYTRSDGGFLLFITRADGGVSSIYYALSEDGLLWTPLEPFAPELAPAAALAPSHAALGSGDHLVFQSSPGEGAASGSRLFLKSSFDGGRTWTPARRIDPLGEPPEDVPPESLDRRNPHLSSRGEDLFLVWEGRRGDLPPGIYGAALGEDGVLQGRPERINSEEAPCESPLAFRYRGETTVVWTGTRRGASRAFLAQRESGLWRNYELSGAAGEAFLVRPLLDGPDLVLLWQQVSPGTSRIYALAPDTTVIRPRLRALNFTPGRRTGGDRARIAWDVPEDTSGIMGFSYLWSQDAEALPSGQILAYPGTSSVEEIAGQDGAWYFTLRAQDFAGNWSPPARLMFLRDTTPPPAAQIIPPPLDTAGYLESNTFSLRWNPPPAPDIAGYTWNLEYLGADRAGESPRLPPPDPSSLPPRIMGTETQTDYVNQENGLWRFTLAAIDEVGNIGPVSSLVFKTDKYVPHTSITYVDARQDEQGILSIRVIGRGFAEGGRIGRIFLDRDGRPPYDREFLLDRGHYRVPSDREIAGLRIRDIEEGRYVLGLEHPLRGLSLTVPLVTVDQFGTVKFGDFSRTWKPSWTIHRERRFVLDLILLVLAGIILLCGIGLFASVRGLGGVAAESTAVRLEAAALITGDIMPMEKKKRLLGIKRRKLSLGVKLSAFTITLALLVVVLVSAPLYVMMTRTQRETLLRGLWDRSAVLLEGIASGARAYLPSANIAELELLPLQTAALPEARYLTITGFGGAIHGDQVWASSDPDILDKIDTAELRPGVSRLEDPLSPRLEEIARELNGRARSELGDLSASIAGLRREALSLSSLKDEAAARRLEDLRGSIHSLEARLSQGLAQIGGGIGAEPDFPLTGPVGNRRYLFFKPILYPQGAEDLYFRGLVRLEVSTESIREQLSLGRRSLLRVLLLVALTAVVIGALGALVLAGFIIRPIKKLVRHVELIRDTEDKSTLEGVDILLQSRDELAALGSTINDMTHGLVKAAQASQDLTIGKEVQKKFIPLEVDREGNKRTSGFKDTRNAQFFGYYEGAKGVSGDYFDYQDLDGRYFAIIKCDVAGKGVPAALIMIQVATMFLNHFKNWKPTAKGMHIEEVVYQINAFIEALGFKGRFAAFTLCLFDSQTGLIRFCNAGDKVIHYFDASERKMKTLSLRESPAAGVLPNDLVESKGGYTIEKLTIDPGDILFLYTDGIEEAKRKFRGPTFKEILCAEGGAPQDTPHGNHVVGQGDEELGAGRVEAIINAVMNREPYTLYKYHNPEGEIPLRFDFTGCQGTVEEAIMAMVSVEKIFRLYKAPSAGEDSRVLVDKKVDGFLREHFSQYRIYCGNSREYPENDMYMYYTHVKEDAQYDDLTIIGIKRKEEIL